MHGIVIVAGTSDRSGKSRVAVMDAACARWSLAVILALSSWLNGPSSLSLAARMASGPFSSNAIWSSRSFLGRLYGDILLMINE